MRSLALLIPLCVGLLACGGGTSSTDMSVTQDLKAAGDMTKIDSICGMPGDKGNSLGVGKFCSTIDECSANTNAKICATIGDPLAHFCTFLCDKNGAPTQCGEGATCECQTQGCGCTPNACLGSTDGGTGG